MTLGRWIVTCLALIFTIGTFGTNATYLFGQGRTIADMGVLGWVAAGFDVALVAIPWAIGWFWRNRKFGCLLSAFPAGCICLLAAFFSSAGFVNANFGDTEAARASAQRQRLALQSDFDQARTDRRRLVFERATQAQVDAAAAALCRPKPTGLETLECRDRRIAHSSLQDRLTKSEEADRLDSRTIPNLQRALAETPAIKAADPQIEAVVLYFSRLSRGSIVLDPRDVDAGRLLIFMAIPLLAGLFFAWAEVLGERRRG